MIGSRRIRLSDRWKRRAAKLVKRLEMNGNRAASLRRRDSGQDLGAHVLDVLERLSEGILIAVVQLHVIPRCRIRSKPDGLTNYKRDSLSLRLPDALRSLSAARGKVQARMRDFVRQYVEFLCGS